MNSPFYAHSLPGQTSDKWQTLKEHLQNVAIRAQTYAQKFKSSKWGYVSGLWHDIGKYSEEFQKMLKTTSPNENEKSFSHHVDHSTAGAQHAIKEYGKINGKILAYVIAGHHTGIPDGKSTEGSCLTLRLQKKIPRINIENEIYIEKKPLEPFPFLSKQDQQSVINSAKQKLLGFKLAFFIRMLYSSLVDADFLDTELFMNPERFNLRKSKRVSQELLEKLETYITNLTKNAPNTPINKKRNEILEYCKEAAEIESGFFSLTVPTGGGKTLSSLYFGIKHAIKHGMDRVIYVIPYTSIIEQNAKIFKTAIGEENVIEHHSTYDYGEIEAPNPQKLATENWDAPVIVTTNVQFFESLFSNRSSKLRKLHNVVNSVIIFDEAQMLPVPLLAPTLEALKELVLTYHSSIVFCTATQPALNKTSKFEIGIKNIREIVPNPKELFKTFKRVTIQFISQLEDDELVYDLLKYKQVLCIVNTRKHAHILYKILYQKNNNGAFHLSALMCPAHRREIIEEIKKSLKIEKTCRVISTQLVEAGVDLDFPVVYRAMSGLDSIIQAAGRCNREGKIARGNVLVFETQTRIPPGLLRQSADITREVVTPNSDITDTDIITQFFSQLYWSQGENLDSNRILEKTTDIIGIDFPFRKIAKEYKLIKTDYVNLIIPYNNKAKDLIEKLRYTREGRQILRQLQQYIIQIPARQFNELYKTGAIEIIKEIYPVLIKNNLYNKNMGLYYEDPEFYDVEELII